jgi:glutaredoxin
VPEKSNKLARQLTFIPEFCRDWQEVRRTFRDFTTQMKNAQIILYSKPGCHLCDRMKDEIAKANCSDSYDLQEVNIESDADLLARYRHDIPVLLIDGVEAFRYHVTADAFRRRVAHASE